METQRKREFFFCASLTCSVILFLSPFLFPCSSHRCLQIVAKRIAHTIVECVTRTIPNERQKIKFPLFINKNAFSLSLLILYLHVDVIASAFIIVLIEGNGASSLYPVWFLGLLSHLIRFLHSLFFVAFLC
jgi:hypothetical protein